MAADGGSESSGPSLGPRRTSTACSRSASAVSRFVRRLASRDDYDVLFEHSITRLFSCYCCTLCNTVVAVEVVAVFDPTSVSV